MPDHHELPQYYLRGFCMPSTSFLWVFQRDMPFLPGKNLRTNNPHQRGLRKTALRGDAYAVRKPEGTISYEYESKLQKKERTADIAIRKIRNYEIIGKFEKDSLTRYIGLTWRRLTSRDKLVRPLIAKELTQSPLIDIVRNLAYSGEFGKAHALQDALEGLHSEDRKTEMCRESMLRDFVKVHSLIMTMRWEFIKAAPDRYFVTMDNPVVFDRHTGLRASPLFFPISQTVMLVASHKEGTDLSYRQASPFETRKLNAIFIGFAEREVYSPYPDAWIHKGMAEGFTFTASNDDG